MEVLEGTLREPDVSAYTLMHAWKERRVREGHLGG